jgi:hypothetical protein
VRDFEFCEILHYTTPALTITISPQATNPAGAINKITVRLAVAFSEISNYSVDMLVRI